MENCNCNEILCEIPEELTNSLSEINLLMPFERLFNANSSSSECLNSIQKSERAEALGLGKDMVNYYKRKAERENEVSIRLLKGASQAFDKLLNSKEWKLKIKKINEAISKPEFSSIKMEHRERVVEAIFEIKVNGDDAKELISIWDEAIESLSKNDISGIISWLNTKIEKYVNSLKPPKYGRQPSSPLTEAQSLCIMGVTASYIALMATCSWVPFCWCCYAGYLYKVYYRGLTACMLFY